MFLIKNVAVNNIKESVCVENYIEVTKLENYTVCNPDFFGKILLNSGAFPKEKKVPSKICSCNSYIANPIGDNFIELCLFDSNNFSKTDVEDNDSLGYIIFINKSLKNIETNAKVLFRRYGTELVAVLDKDGDYIKVDGIQFEYKNKKVFYTVCI